jgi:hypothetical protein
LKFLIAGVLFLLGAPVLPAALIASAQAATAVTCGGANDTATIQAALNAGGEIDLPAGVCLVPSGALKMAKSGTHLIGQGPGTTTLRFAGAGSSDGVRLGTFPDPASCTGNSAPANCQQTYNLSIANLSVEAPNRTGGFLFDANGVSQVTIKDIECGGWDMLGAQFFNTLTLDRVSCWTQDSANFAISLYQPLTGGTAAGWYRSDVMTLDDVNLNEQNSGGGCLNWDGMINTVRMDHVALLGCSYGLVLSNSQHSTSWFPADLMATDLEIDGSLIDGIVINAGRDIHLIDSDIDDCGAGQPGGYALVVAPDQGGSWTSGIFISGTAIHCAPAAPADIDARGVTITGSQFYDGGHDGQPWAGVEIGPHSDEVAIHGNAFGRWGDPTAPGQGVQVDAGATNVDIAGAVGQ